MTRTAATTTLLRRSGRRAAGERGAAMVETALVLPMVLLLLFGILEFGRALNYWNDTNQLAGEGARYAAVNRIPQGSSLKGYLISRAMPELQSGSERVGAMQVCITYPNGTSRVGDPVKVEVRSRFNFLPFVGDAISLAGVDIVGDATMRLEQLPSGIDAGCS